MVIYEWYECRDTRIRSVTTLESDYVTVCGTKREVEGSMDKGLLRITIARLPGSGFVFYEALCTDVVTNY